MFFKQYIGRYIKAHHISRAALTVGCIVAAVLFFVIGAGIRLLIGPVSLGALRGPLSDALAQALPGISVQYDQAAIEWSRDQGRINLVILGAHVFDAEGRDIAQAPKADIDLAAAPFLQGTIAVQRITLVGVQLALVRTRAGELRLGSEKDIHQHDFLSRIVDAVSASSSKASTLLSFAVRDARLSFYDDASRFYVAAPSANFKVSTAGAGLNATLDGRIEIAGHEAQVNGEFALPAGKGPIKGALALKGLNVRALASDGQAFVSLKPFGLVLDMSASFAMEGTRLSSLDFGIGANGDIDAPGLSPKPIGVKGLQAVGRYDGATNRILIDDATLSAEKTSAHMTGRVELHQDPTGVLDRVALDLALDKIALTMPDVFAQTINLKSAALRGSVVIPTREISLAMVQVSGAPFSLQASGKIVLVPGKSPALDLKGQMGGMSIHDMLRYWPLKLAGGARDWTAHNFFAGSIGTVGFEADMPAGMMDQAVLPEAALKVTMPIENAEVNYVDGLTHITQLRGTILLTGDTFSAEIASGHIGHLALSKGNAVITPLHVDSAPGVITAHVDGAMPDILALIDLKPLRYPTRFGVSPTQTTGSAGLDVGFHLPMRRDLRIDDVGISIKAAIKDFSIALSEHARLTDGLVDLTIDNARLRAKGNATLVDSRLTFDWTEEFVTNEPVTTRIGVQGVLDVGGRDALNIPTSGFLTGPVTINAMLTGHRGALSTADMTMDLAQAALGFDVIGMSKPPGFPATAHVGAVFGPGSAIRSETMKLSGPGIVADGSSTFDKDGHLTSLVFPTLKVGSADDFSLNVTRGAAGLDIVLRGHSLDGTRVAAKKTPPGQSATGSAPAVASKAPTLEGPFHIDAKLDRLLLRSGVTVSPISVDVTGFSDRPATMTVSGTLGKTGEISVSLARGDGGRRLSLTAGDAGLLAKGLFGFSSMKGGRVDVKGLLPGDATDTAPRAASVPDYRGTMSLSDFTVVNQPFLTRLFSAGSLGGMINLMQGQGIAVDKLDVPFSARNGVIEIHDAHATGPAIGITADGYIDRPKNVVALKGSLVPLFGVNSVLGNIPLIGNVLVSRPGEGVFGMTYSMTGNADEPNVSINPLSVLTPGILRRIFEGKIPTAAQAPSNAPMQDAPK